MPQGLTIRVADETLWLGNRAGHDDARDDVGRAAVRRVYGRFSGCHRLTAQLLRGVEGGRPALTARSR